MLSRILRGQKGAFLVLTAILVPVIFLFTCLAADLGKGWAYQVQASECGRCRCAGGGLCV